MVDIAKNLKPSHRGELEITDENKIYLEMDALEAGVLDRNSVVGYWNLCQPETSRSVRGVH